MNILDKHISESRLLHVQQVWETMELLGFETRNKYRILDEEKRSVGFAAEESRGISGALGRHFLGHWRTFKVPIFDNNHEIVYTLAFPFKRCPRTEAWSSKSASCCFSEKV